MPLKSFQERKDIKSILANVDSPNNGETLYRAGLFKVKSDGTIDATNLEISTFLLNPESYEESKSSNWAQQSVPGQSDPILQWVNSGPRTLSFEALVTIDTSYYKSGVTTKPGEQKDPIKKTLSIIGEVASAFFKVTLPPPRKSQDSQGVGRSLDISNYLNYYRSMLYPEYGQQYSNNLSATVTKSPPLLVLYSGDSINRIPLSNKITTNTDVWVLTDLKINITKQLPNLAPMEAKVQFTLMQYNIRSFDARRF